MPGIDKIRLEKLKNIVSLGLNPYPYNFRRTHYSLEITNNYQNLEGKKASVAGRIIQFRDFGGIIFLHLLDQKGKIQIMVRKDNVKEDVLRLCSFLDLGDIIGVEGQITKTKKGEISINASKIEILSKSLRFLPDKFKGLSDTELRYRKRYLDLIANPSIKNYFIVRQKIIDSIRNFLNSKGYLEVDTPVLQKVYGGAAAKPFITFHNALNQKLYLRISNELFLKRLIIGGLEKVYEFSKDFRNEDIDSTHNPEFTQVEFYEAYKDYYDYMQLTKEMFDKILQDLNLPKKINFGPHLINFTNFRTISLYDEIKKKTSIDILNWKNPQEAYEQVLQKGLKPSKKTFAKCVEALVDNFVLKDIFDPIFLVDFPYYMCPLTKRKRDNPLLAERFELFIGGIECGNCYSELTDPIEQRNKFLEQAKELNKGDEESNPIDEDFLEAIEYGMPPTAGMGLGIDRLAMIFTNNNTIKEVILFPSMRD
ncbi:MAG: lysine--tRNA ligase [Candidatus Omnitrophica bacterium]|nr:lysine--tRNA ligase [Candidatus Omnitrophota bacterium]